MFVAGAIFLRPDIRDLRSIGVLRKLLVQEMMSTVRRTARAYCLTLDWIGAPSAGWPWRRLPVEWTGHIKCCEGTSPVSRVDRRRVLSAINAETARPRGLTSGSTRWLMSRATSHVATSGLRLSGERMQAG
jgi:hypothetical protein